MISKSLSTSEKYAKLHQVAGPLAEFCQALYPLLVSNADDFGRLPGDAFTVKFQCFPTSPRSRDEFSNGLQSMHNVGLITLYVVDTKEYIEIEQFDQHQQGLHKRTSSTFPEVPGDSRKFRVARARGTEPNLTEQNGREGKILVTENKLDRKANAVSASGNGNGAHRYPTTSIIGKNTHLTHVACDPAFSYCVPDAVHRKLADLLAPKHAGDREMAKAALLLWYPTVWIQIADGTVMGDSFRFWQAHFDRAFASQPITKTRMSVAELTEAVRADMKAAGEL